MSNAAFSIRRARPEDAPVMTAAQREIAAVPGKLASRPEEINEDTLRTLTTALDGGTRGIFLVADEGGVLVGHGMLEALSLATTAHVVRLTLAVHEGHARRGIGRALMNALLDWARASHHVEKVELQVRSSNEPAIALYRALGFVEEGRKIARLKIGAGQYLDDVYMALWVGPTRGA